MYEGYCAYAVCFGHLKQRAVPLQGKMWTFADISWHNPRTMQSLLQGLEPHPLARVSDAIVPVSTPALGTNHRRYPHRPPYNADERERRRAVREAGALLQRVWPEFWRGLPQPWKTKIQMMRNTYPPHLDRCAPRTYADARLHSSPFKLSPSTFKLPWHRLLVGDEPLATISEKSIMRAMAPRRYEQRQGENNLMRGQAREVERTSVVVPLTWAALAGGSRDEWRSMWARLDDLRLPTPLWADNLLFGWCGAALATQPPRKRSSAFETGTEVVDKGALSSDSAREDVEEEEVDAGKEGEDDDQAPELGEAAAGSANGMDVDGDDGWETDEEEEDRQAAENARVSLALEEEDMLAKRQPAFDVLPCPACHGPRDSVPHAYCVCPHARRFWSACLPVLRELLGQDVLGHDLPVPTLGKSEIVLGWPEYKPVPQHLRAEKRPTPAQPLIERRHAACLLLWRCCVIHQLAELRRRAFATSRQTGKKPEIEPISDLDFARAVRATLVETIEAAILLPRHSCFSSTGSGSRTATRCRRPQPLAHRQLDPHGDGHLGPPSRRHSPREDRTSPLAHASHDHAYPAIPR